MDKNNASVVVAGILTLFVLAMMSSTNQSFAQAKPTNLSLGWCTYRAHVCESVGLGPKGLTPIPPSQAASIKLSGQLTSGCGCEKPGCPNKNTPECTFVRGATIQITGTGRPGQELDMKVTETTDNSGLYSINPPDLTPGTYQFEAHYAGDSHHESSSATKTITVSPP